jgi:hypothetical protein
MAISDISHVECKCRLCNRLFIPVSKSACPGILTLEYLCIDCNIYVRRNLINRNHQVYFN